mgnify:CR=1 FL=1
MESTQPKTCARRLVPRLFDLELLSTWLVTCTLCLNECKVADSPEILVKIQDEQKRLEEESEETKKLLKTYGIEDQKVS